MFELKIDSNLAQAARKLGWDAANIDDAADKALRAAAKSVNAAAGRRIARIYARAIPLSKKGRPLWVRTGNLARGRTLSYPAPGVAQIAITGAAEQYALRRHQLGVTWQPRRPALGLVRRNPFFAEAQEQTEPKVGEVFERVFRRQMGL